jgi:hypothetical protein
MQTALHDCHSLDRQTSNDELRGCNSKATRIHIPSSGPPPILEGRAVRNKQYTLGSQTVLNLAQKNGLRSKTSQNLCHIFYSCSQFPPICHYVIFEISDLRLVETENWGSTLRCLIGMKLTSQGDVYERRSIREHSSEGGRHAYGSQSRHGEGNRETVPNAVQ